jgi:hypothetical protein
MERHARALVALTASAAAAALIAVTVAGPALARNRDPGVAFKPGTGQSVIDWNKELITIVNTPKVQPPAIHPTRSFAMLQAAEYDAVVSITHADRPSLVSVDAPPRSRPDAAADQAAHDVLIALCPSMAPAVDQLLSAELQAIPDGSPKREGIKVGSTVAARVVQNRSSDGSGATPAAFVPGTGPGDYRPTPPNFPAPVFTNWGTIRPFVLESGSQFRPAAPPAVTSADYAAALNEVENLGRDSSTTRTADQTSIAKLWGAAPIWNVWNEIAQRTVDANGASLENAVTVFSQLDFALADTAIALYDGKYHDQVWRPVTAIRLGDTAGNPGIVGDPTWTPLAVTAPDPSYPGAHSGFSEAAATVLSSFYGRHEHLAVTSDGMPGVTRTFPSFQAAADEAGFSRILAGQHTRLDHVAGEKLGKQVADFVLDNSE